MCCGKTPRRTPEHLGGGVGNGSSNSDVHSTCGKTEAQRGKVKPLSEPGPQCGWTGGVQDGPPRVTEMLKLRSGASHVPSSAPIPLGGSFSPSPTPHFMEDQIKAQRGYITSSRPQS